jgi:hypothetical protein
MQRAMSFGWGVSLSMATQPSNSDYSAIHLWFRQALASARVDEDLGPAVHLYTGCGSEGRGGGAHIQPAWAFACVQAQDGLQLS